MVSSFSGGLLLFGLGLVGPEGRATPIWAQRGALRDGVTGGSGSKTRLRWLAPAEGQDHRALRGAGFEMRKPRNIPHDPSGLGPPLGDKGCIAHARHTTALVVFLIALLIALKGSWGSLWWQLSFICHNLHLTYDEKMGIKWGEYYAYMVFVYENTPADATIVIPAEGDQWSRTGNVGLDGYFLYPRRLVTIDRLAEAGYAMVVEAEDGSGAQFPPHPLPPGNILWMRAGRGVLVIRGEP